MNHIKVQSKEENLLKNIINRYLLSNMKKEKDLDSEILSNAIAITNFTNYVTMNVVDKFQKKKKAIITFLLLMTFFFFFEKYISDI